MIKIEESKVTTEIQLVAALDEAASRVRALLGSQLVSIIHFGSTVMSPVKYATDIDVLVVVETLSPRDPRGTKESGSIEERLGSLLEPFLAVDRQFSWSVIVRSRAQASRFSKLYLDMVDRSRVLADDSGFFERIRLAAAQWIRTSGAKRHSAGSKTYWELGDEEAGAATWPSF